LFIAEIIGNWASDCIRFIFRKCGEFIFDYIASFLYSLFAAVLRDIFFEAMEKAGAVRGESIVKDLMLIPVEFSMKN
jgi:hypothetical protein